MAEDAELPTENATALITGASSGIGEATAKALADSGARVSLAARRKSRLDTLVAAIESSGGRALAVPTDVTDEDDIDALVETTLETFGSIDILVNNAGVMLLEPLERADRENLRRMIEVNLLGAMNLTHAVLPVMQEQGRGHIVNVSSTSGRFARPNTSGYNASKFGLNGFTEALRQEITTQNLRTTLIEPGATRTELSDHIPDEEAKERILDEFEDSNTLLHPEDVARTIAYVVTQPQRVSINEVLVTPTGQVSY